jgi:hypothetical protein
MTAPKLLQLEVLVGDKVQRTLVKTEPNYSLRKQDHNRKQWASRDNS